MVKHINNKFQERFSHYLKSFRLEQNLSQVDLSKKLDCSVHLITKFENKKSTSNRLIASLAFLKQFADLEKLTITEFISYIEDGGLEKHSGNSWKDKILKTFTKLKTRNQFQLLDFLNQVDDDDEHLNQVMDLTTKLNQLSINDLKFIGTMIDRMEKNEKK